MPILSRNTRVWLATTSNQSNDEIGWIEETILPFIPAACCDGRGNIIGLTYFISRLISKPIEEIHDIIFN